ncbi:hypothetical protein B0T20DRAFT_495579 [Sordaria brevicollis]|uniref:Uncharacterized protein n=1 Tax=Sordaria brevicollis TaxID=83679 RepID=A0AAE0UDB2_SORBR|nr:hypothetical protein B0T20DRAFT_495579 [Sordaria brevicollis]
MCLSPRKWRDCDQCSYWRDCGKCTPRPSLGEFLIQNVERKERETNSRPHMAEKNLVRSMNDSLSHLPLDDQYVWEFRLLRLMTATITWWKGRQAEDIKQASLAVAREYLKEESDALLKQKEELERIKKQLDNERKKLERRKKEMEQERSQLDEKERILHSKLDDLTRKEREEVTEKWNQLAHVDPTSHQEGSSGKQQRGTYTVWTVKQQAGKKRKRAAGATAIRKRARRKIDEETKVSVSTTSIAAVDELKQIFASMSLEEGSKPPQQQQKAPPSQLTSTLAPNSKPNATTSKPAPTPANKPANPPAAPRPKFSPLEEAVRNAMGPEGTINLHLNNVTKSSSRQLEIHQRLFSKLNVPTETVAAVLMKLLRHSDASKLENWRAFEREGKEDRWYCWFGLVNYGERHPPVAERKCLCDQIRETAAANLNMNHNPQQASGLFVNGFPKPYCMLVRKNSNFGLCSFVWRHILDSEHVRPYASTYREKCRWKATRPYLVEMKR